MKLLINVNYCIANLINIQLGIIEQDICYF